MMKIKKCKCGAPATQGSIAIHVYYCTRSAMDMNFCDGKDRLEYDS